MREEGTVILANGEEKEIFLHCVDPDISAIGSEMFEMTDGSLMVSGATMWRTTDYRTFERYPLEGEQTAPISNYIRLKDGRLLAVFGETVENIFGNRLKASNFYCVISEDDGLTFGERIPISTGNERLYLMNNRIKRLTDGRLALPMCLHPNCLLEDEKSFEGAGWITLFWSEDEGQTWSHGEWLETSQVDQLCEPTVCEMPDGHLKMLARTGRSYLYQTDSYDGGRTWCTEYSTGLRSPISPYNFWYDSYSKKYFVCWNDSFPKKPPQQPRTPMKIAVSDDGVSWETLFTLGCDPEKTYGYPAFHFTPEEIHVTYYINPGKDWSLSRIHFAAIPRSYHEKMAVKP